MYYLLRLELNDRLSIYLFAGLPLRPLVLFSSVGDLINMYWSGAGQEKTTLMEVPEIINLLIFTENLLIRPVYFYNLNLNQGIFTNTFAYHIFGTNVVFISASHVDAIINNINAKNCSEMIASHCILQGEPATRRG